MSTSLFSQAEGGQGVFELPPLPYEQNALEPFVSASTLYNHYGKHHRAYVENLNKMVAGTDYTKLSLENLIRKTALMPDKALIYNTAAQVWNHAFFWHSMRQGGGGRPPSPLMERLVNTFGSFEAFKNAFMIAALSHFGSGGVWLVQDAEKMKIIKTANAENPIIYGLNALLTCDVWEHAYYLDYQNRRKDFVQNFLDHLANWDFASSRLK